MSTSRSLRAAEGENVDEDAEDLPYRPPYLEVTIDLAFHTGHPACKLIDRSNGLREVANLRKGGRMNRAILRRGKSNLFKGKLIIA